MPPLAGARQVVFGPHIQEGTSGARIMLLVVGALTPAALWSVAVLGAPALIVYASCILSCLATEFAWNAALRRPQTLKDGSALVTGILLAMCMPPLTPWWICMVGGIVAIGLAKMLFGGLGFNLFNPALVGRAVALLSWLGVMGELKPYSGGWVSALSIPAVGQARRDQRCDETRPRRGGPCRAGRLRLQPLRAVRRLALPQQRGQRR